MLFEKAPRNQTIELTEQERTHLQTKLFYPTSQCNPDEVVGRTIHGDIFSIVNYLPNRFVDLLILDPPYNLNKNFNATNFHRQSTEEYATWFESWFLTLLPVLKPDATVYICADWQSSAAIYPVLEKNLIIRNRITWEREKGRGAKANWKNASEDIWFCTVSEGYKFDVEAVKLRRKVLAPYKQHGEPKDWVKTEDGNIRLTHPSNLWTDISVPFWSMPENTEHSTQKPEKLLAKLILASSQPGDIVMDPFLGSGTTSVVAKKLGRKYVGIEMDETYACIAEKRIELASNDTTIQGYIDGLFWERNSQPSIKSESGNPKDASRVSKQVLGDLFTTHG